MLCNKRKYAQDIDLQHLANANSQQHISTAVAFIDLFQNGA